MNSIIYYTLRAELHTRKGEGKLQSFLFDREYIVKYLGKRGENSTYYDPELNMHFENKSALSFVYQIEVNNNHFLLPGTFEKAAGFTKSVNYMFDWIQLQVSLQGKIRSIENKDEIKKRWNVLKESLLSNYKGHAIDTYLAEIDSKFEDEGVLSNCIVQYFNFGLLFPPIPIHHGKDWQHKGLIEFSEYDREKFEALITFSEEKETQMIYNLDIKATEESGFKLEQYQGNIIMQKNEHLPLSAIVEVVFRNDDMAYQWGVILKRY